MFWSALAPKISPLLKSEMECRVLFCGLRNSSFPPFLLGSSPALFSAAVVGCPGRCRCRVVGVAVAVGVAVGCRCRCPVLTCPFLSCLHRVPFIILSCRCRCQVSLSLSLSGVAVCRVRGLANSVADSTPIFCEGYAEVFLHPLVRTRRTCFFVCIQTDARLLPQPF